VFVTAQPAIQSPPRFVLPAVVVGILLTLLLTPLASFSPFLLGPNDGPYALILAGIVCLVALIPMGIIGAIVGVVFGVYYRGLRHRLATGSAVLIGVITALIVFALVVALLYVTLGAGMDTLPPSATLIQWLSPSLVCLLLGYAILSLWVNRRLPAA
jgi:hypothetical protein